MARNPVTRIIITAKDEASAVFSGLRAHAGKIATAIAGYFSAKLFGDVVGAARDFESAMSAVQAASGASGDELAKLRAAAEQAGATTKYSSVEAANALENLAKSGLSASQAVEALPAVLNLASAGGVELGTAAEFITKAVNGMGLEFSEAGRVADVLAMGANASNTSVTGLAQALSYAAPLANSLGLSLEQTVAIIGKFADAGIDASRAGTALNSILAQFSDPASKFRKELADAGITTGDFDQALRQLAAAGPAGQRAINAVGQEAGPALRALLNQGIGALDTLKGKLDESAGSAATFAKVMSDNLDGATKGFGSAWDALLIKLGTPVLGTLATQINAVSDRLRAFVTDGTATAFGNAIRAAFESGGKWVADFVSKVDFKQLAADMQAFAARTGELFDALGTKSGEVARNATIAFGVLSTSLNIILAAVFKVSEAFAGVGSNITSVAAWIAEAFSKITFGAMSESFRAAADEIRIAAGGLWATSEAFAQQSSAAFDRATADALRVREAWDGVGVGVAAASTQAATALEAVGTQAGLTAEQVAALGEGAVVMGGQVIDAGKKATTAAGNVKALGNAADGAAGEVAALEKSAEQVASAFERLGVTSSAELKRMAANARRDFETIRDSGTASAEDVRRAFAAYAEKAIEANNGVADWSLRAEAAIYRMGQAGTTAGAEIESGMGGAADSVGAIGNQADRSAEALRRLQQLQQQGGGGGGGGGGGRPGGTRDQEDDNVYLAENGAMYAEIGNGGTEALFKKWASEKKGPTGPAESPVLGILNRAEQLGGLEMRKQFEEEFQRRAKRQGMRVASFGTADYNRFWQSVSDQLDAIQIEQERASGRYESNQPRIVGQQPREQITTYRVQIGTGAGRSRTINTASRADADALTELLRQLEADMSRS